MKVPFISITDFTTREQVFQMLAIARRFNGPEIPVRKLGVGVMMSYTTLNEIPSPYLNAFPRNHKIAGIFIADDLAFNVLHYADYKERDFARCLQIARNWASYNLHAIQLDMTWPDPNVLADFRDRNRKVEIILQIGTNAFDAIDHDPAKLVKKLKIYGQSVNYVLLDKSMGRGKLLDPNGLRPYISQLARERPELGIIIAGGLGPDNINFALPLIQDFPHLSLDAQGMLRPSGNMLDQIDWTMAGQYLERAYQLF